MNVFIIQIFKQMTHNQQSANKKQKLFEVSSYGSDSPESQEDNYACVAIQPKKQQKNDQCSGNIQSAQNTQNCAQANLQRQRRPNEDKKRQTKNKKRNKKNLNDGDQMIKKQSKKRYAAPPQLLTESSKQNSSSCRSKSSERVEIAAPEQPKQSRRLYIGNLQSEISESQIRKLFKKYGSLKQVKLAINTTTGKSKGFAFVEYLDLHSSTKAKEQLSSHILGGLKMIIEFCSQQ